MKTILIAKRIKFLLKEQGMKQGELARRTGMDISRISRIVNGLTNPTIATIERMEEVLGEQIISVL